MNPPALFNARLEIMSAPPDTGDMRRTMILALITLLPLITAGSSASPVISDSIWGSRLVVKDGVSDFGNRTFADLFRDAKFQEVVTRDGVTVTFQLETKSMSGNEAVIDFVMKRDGVESERFSFFFRSLGNSTLLYKLTSDRGTVTGPDDLLLAMRRFYLPCLLEQ